MGIKAISIGGRSDIKEVKINGGLYWKKPGARWEYPVKTGDILRITQAWHTVQNGSLITLDAPYKGYDVELSGIGPYGFEQSAIVNPDSSLYDGVYQSNNKGVNSSNAVMKITFHGYAEFNVYIRSYAESNYDYTIASKIDASSYPTAYNDATANAHTRGNQKSGTAISNYTKVSYPNDGGEHFIYVVYRKDSSAASGDDRGYVLIER